MKKLILSPAVPFTALFATANAAMADLPQGAIVDNAKQVFF